MLNYASLLHTIFKSLEHANERVHIHVHNITHFPQAKLNSERNACFLLHEHNDLYDFLFHNFNENSILDN